MSHSTCWMHLLERSSLAQAWMPQGCSPEVWKAVERSGSCWRSIARTGWNILQALIRRRLFSLNHSLPLHYTTFTSYTRPLPTHNTITSPLRRHVHSPVTTANRKSLHELPSHCHCCRRRRRCPGQYRQSLQPIHIPLRIRLEKHSLTHSPDTHLSI